MRQWKTICWALILFLPAINSIHTDWWWCARMCALSEWMCSKYNTYITKKKLSICIQNFQFGIGFGFRMREHSTALAKKRTCFPHNIYPNTNRLYAFYPPLNDSMVARLWLNNCLEELFLSHFHGCCYCYCYYCCCCFCLFHRHF